MTTFTAIAASIVIALGSAVLITAAAQTAARRLQTRRVTITCEDCGHKVTRRLTGATEFWAWALSVSSAHTLASTTCTNYDAYLPDAWAAPAQHHGKDGR